MPLYFIENRGQLDPRVAFYVQGRDKTLYFTEQGITFALADSKPRETVVKGRLEKASRPLEREETAAANRHWVVKLDFVEANSNVKIAGEDKTAAVISYFKGPREQWKTGLSTYSRVLYFDLWPGIDLVYSGAANHLKYTFVVEPGADPTMIRLAYRGATGVRLDGEGRLRVETPFGGFSDERPYSYQEIGGKKVEVATAYAIQKSNGPGGSAYGFEFGAYDRTKRLVLDPAVLVYAGYIGGGGDDYGYGIAVDAAGNAYVTGLTTPADDRFPETVGPDLNRNGSIDAFVAKIDGAGTGLAYAGYIGGASDDYGQGIAVDAAGNAYVTGYTSSSDFPVSVGPDLASNGGIDTFVAKVDAAGTGLAYAGYIGGTSDDYGQGIALDVAGNAYIAGWTISSDFPVTVGPDLTSNGGIDTFVAKVNAAGTGLAYAGYIGGSSVDFGEGITVDLVGNAYVTGSTSSSNFPATVGPDLTYNGGSYDAFVTKIDAAGTGLAYAGFIGGGFGGFFTDPNDFGRGIAVDSAGNAYVAGLTYSQNFPIIGSPNPPLDTGLTFVTKVDAAGTGLSYSRRIGRASYAQGIAVDGAGNAYVAGWRGVIADSSTYGAWLAKLNAAGTELAYELNFGSSRSDGCYGVAVDVAGDAYLTGFTSDRSFPATVGPDLTFNGLVDAFVAKISEVALPPTDTPPPTQSETATHTPTANMTHTPIGTPTLTASPTSTTTPSRTVTPTSTRSSTPTVSPTQTPPMPVVYDAFTGFSFVSNPTPDGIWSYGYTLDMGGTLTLYTMQDTDFSLSIWERPGARDPNVIKNETGAAIVVFGQILFPTADFVHFHPGPSGEFSVIRWTATASGRYRLDATFRSLRIAGADTTTTVHVLKGAPVPVSLPNPVRPRRPVFAGSTLFTGSIESNADVLNFSTEIRANAGEFIDFAVGANGNYFSDSTGLRATLTLLE